MSLETSSAVREELLQSVTSASVITGGDLSLAFLGVWFDDLLRRRRGEGSLCDLAGLGTRVAAFSSATAGAVPPRNMMMRQRIAFAAPLMMAHATAGARQSAVPTARMSCAISSK